MKIKEKPMSSGTAKATDGNSRSGSATGAISGSEEDDFSLATCYYAINENIKESSFIVDQEEKLAMTKYIVQKLDFQVQEENEYINDKIDKIYVIKLIKFMS